MKIMVAYDGTVQAKEALVYGMEQAREKGGQVLALHVFDPHVFMGYDAHIDAETLARQESLRFVDEAKALIREKGDGIRASLFTTEGDPEEEVMNFAQDRRIDVLLCPPRFKSLVKKYQEAIEATEFAGAPSHLNIAVLQAKAV